MSACLVTAAAARMAGVIPATCLSDASCSVTACPKFAPSFMRARKPSTISFLESGRPVSRSVTAASRAPDSREFRCSFTIPNTCACCASIVPSGRIIWVRLGNRRSPTILYAPAEPFCPAVIRIGNCCGRSIPGLPPLAANDATVVAAASVGLLPSLYRVS